MDKTDCEYDMMVVVHVFLHNQFGNQSYIDKIMVYMPNIATQSLSNKCCPNFAVPHQFYLYCLPSIANNFASMNPCTIVCLRCYAMLCYHAIVVQCNIEYILYMMI